MRNAVAVAAIVLTLGMSLAMDADAARRFGGGKSTGMQRQTTSQPAPSGSPGSPATAAGQVAPAGGAAAGATTAAAAPKRSWMGPIAGLAAGLGLAALASHLGLGAAMGNLLMFGLLAMAALALVGFVMRKRAAGAAGSLAPAGAGGGLSGGRPGQGGLIGSRVGGGIDAPARGASAGVIPAGFDVPAFERNAKDQFMALQSANDARDLDRLRDFLTPQMLEAVQADLAGRGEAPQRTEVFGLQAQVLEVVEEADTYVVSVRFSGSVRDEAGAVPEDLNEVWHLVKPRSGFGGWLIAGIQQAA